MLKKRYHIIPADYEYFNIDDIWNNRIGIVWKNRWKKWQRFTIF